MLSIINVLSNSLLNKTSRGALGFSKNVILGVIKTLESLWCEDELKKIWEQVKMLTEENGIFWFLALIIGIYRQLHLPMNKFCIIW